MIVAPYYGQVFPAVAGFTLILPNMGLTAPPLRFLDCYSYRAIGIQHPAVVGLLTKPPLRVCIVKKTGEIGRVAFSLPVYFHLNI